MRITYYNNHYDSEKERIFRQQVFESCHDDYGWENESDVPDSMIDAEIAYENYFDWQFFLNDLERLLKTHHCLLVGTFGSWCGPKEGGKFIDTVSDFLSCVEHLDYMDIYEENGHLYVHGCHHDGNDSYELKVLTDKGYRLAEHNYFAHDRKLHATLFHCNFYSKLPRLSSAI